MTRRATIRTRLLALLALPTLALVALTAIAAVEATAISRETAGFVDLAAVVDTTAETVDALESERATVLSTLASSPDGPPAEVPGTVEDVRRRSDATLLTLQAALDRAGLGDQVAAIGSMSRDLQSLERAIERGRAGLADGTLTPLAAVAPLTEAVRDLLATMDQIALEPDQPDLRQRLQAQAALAHVKDLTLRQGEALLAAAAGLQDRATAAQQVATLAAQRDVWLQVSDSLMTSVERQSLDALLPRDTVPETGAPLGQLPPVQDIASETDALAAELRLLQRQLAATTATTVTDLGETAQQQLLLRAGLVVVAVMVGMLVALVTSRSITRPLRALTRTARRVRDELPQTVAALRSGSEDVALATDPERAALMARSDEFGDLAQAVDAATGQAVRVAVDQARIRAGVAETIKDVARREQALVERQLELLEHLEQAETDPDALAELFRLDHLATRLRRNAENLLVLTGADHSATGDGRAAPLIDVARSAAAEIEEYARVTVDAPPGPMVAGFAAAPLAHLLAELLENATTFSPPHAPVEVTVTTDPQGTTVVSVRDHGIGMTSEEMADAQARIDEPPLLEAAESRRLGLYVVGLLAARLGVAVTLRPARPNGLVVDVALPAAVLGADSEEALPPGEQLPPSEEPAAQRTPEPAAETPAGLPVRKPGTAPARPAPPAEPEPAAPEPAPRPEPAPAPELEPVGLHNPAGSPAHTDNGHAPTPASGARPYERHDTPEPAAGGNAPLPQRALQDLDRLAADGRGARFEPAPDAAPLPRRVPSSPATTSEQAGPPAGATRELSPTEAARTLSSLLAGIQRGTEDTEDGAGRRPAPQPPTQPAATATGSADLSWARPDAWSGTARETAAPSTPSGSHPAAHADADPGRHGWPSAPPAATPPSHPAGTPVEPNRDHSRKRGRKRQASWSIPLRRPEEH